MVGSLNGLPGVGYRVWINRDPWYLLGACPSALWLAAPGIRLGAMREGSLAASSVGLVDGLTEGELRVSFPTQDIHNCSDVEPVGFR